MAEGGVYPWKVQKIHQPQGGRLGSCQYSDLKNPLPDPPKGMAWIEIREGSQREWKLVPVAKAQVEEPPSPSSPSSSPPPSTSSASGADSPIMATVRPLGGGKARSTATTTTTTTATAMTTGEAFVAIPVINITNFQSSKSGQDNINHNYNHNNINNNKNNNHNLVNDDEEEDIIIQNGIHYHQVTDTDTLQGLCLKYNISALDLRRANKFMGQVNLRYLVGERIVIPAPKNNNNNGQARRKSSSSGSNNETAAAAAAATTTTTTMNKEEKIASLLNQFQCKMKSMNNTSLMTRMTMGQQQQQQQQHPPLSNSEARAYLELNDWKLTKARENVWQDYGWK